MSCHVGKYSSRMDSVWKNHPAGFPVLLFLWRRGIPCFFVKEGVSLPDPSESGPAIQGNSEVATPHTPKRGRGIPPKKVC